jgi:ribonuclease T1
VRSRLRRTRRPLIALVVLVAALVVAYVVKGLESDQGTGTPFPSASASASASPSGSRSASASAQGIALSSLPAQAAQTVRLVQAGGPFPYPANDGVVYHNLNHDLPRAPDGYYHEYTVPTPGEQTRGARRLVRGNRGEYWYTGDHYGTLVRVDVNQ